jgi:hypothetical protein
MSYREENRSDDDLAIVIGTTLILVVVGAAIRNAVEPYRPAILIALRIMQIGGAGGFLLFLYNKSGTARINWLFCSAVIGGWLLVFQALIRFVE